MVWTNAGTVKLGTSWIYSDPLEGEYFRFRHSVLLEDTFYLLGQAAFNTDGSIEFLNIEQRLVRQKLEIIKLKNPGILINRRLAFKRLNKGESFEEQIRKIVSVTVLKPRSSQFPAQRSDWSIDLEVSDVVDVAGSGAATTVQTIPLTYAAGGDTNGIFYYLGTNKLTETFTNPVDRQLVKATQSSAIGDQTAKNLVGRDNAVFHTNNDYNNAYFELDITPYKLIIESYSLKGRDDSYYHLLRNWRLLGRVKTTDEFTLLDQVVNGGPDQAVWYNNPVPGQSVGYSQFRLVQNGINSSGQGYLTLGEIELYGKLIKP